MISLFLSPHFPPHYHLFCSALRERGVKVLGLGDAPREALRPEVRAALDDYVFVARLEDEDATLRATAWLISQHGRIDHVDSLNEHWLEVEARLREDFNVPGPRLDDVVRYRSKSFMRSAFADVGLDVPACVPLSDAAGARALAEKAGFPLVCKPDRGVGAADVFVVHEAAELERLIETDGEDRVVQPYVRGALTSYDGIVDHDGNIIYDSSFVYSSGVLEIVRDQLDVYYYTRRAIPEALERAGRAMVQSFGLRSRFFHAELFETPDGRYVPVEVNVRPPGGFSTHLMDYGADVDVHRLWADVVVGRGLSAFTFERKFFAAHVSRRPGRRYARSHAEVVAALGGALLFWQDLAPVLAHAMGTPVYVIRHEDEAELLRLIGIVHER